MAKIIVRLTHAPYGESFAADGLEFAFSATNYGHEAALLFEGEGVLQLLKNQQPPQGVKNQFKRVKASALFEIEQIYVCCDSLAKWNIDYDDLPSGYTPVDVGTLLKVLSGADHVVTF